MSKILIVDDSKVEIKIIRRLLHDEYEIIEANTGQQAIEAAKKARPDLILLDIIMPQMDGFSVCKTIKAYEDTADIPVIFITAVSDNNNIVKGFEIGGQDYITKPFCARELCARIKVHLELKKSKEELQEYAAELENKNLELNILLEKLERSAMTDFVTGLINRRRMTQKIKAQIAENKRSHQISTIILADIDNFKKVNDTYGHDCGDLALKSVADLMRGSLREEDVTARWGGEEFLLMLPNTDLTDGYNAAEKIRAAVEKTVFSYHEKEFFLTITLGVAELLPSLGIDGSIRRADEALYKGKDASKNCVVVTDLS